MSNYEFSINLNLALYFIERIRQAKRYINLSGPYVANIATMARDSFEINVIRIHSVLDKSLEFQKFKPSLDWAKFSRLRNLLAHEAHPERAKDALSEITKEIDVLEDLIVEMLVN